MAMAAPAAASGARAAAGKVAGKRAALGGAAAGAGMPERPERGSWKKRAQEPRSTPAKPSPKGAGSRALAGAAGKYRRMLIAEFLVCVMMLALSPLAKKSGEMGPVRFMKRGSATCAFFIILGLISSAGRGAARASSMFGALVVLVLLVDQREAFGKLATILNATDDDDADKAAAPLGPDDSTASDEDPGSVAV